VFQDFETRYVNTTCSDNFKTRFNYKARDFENTRCCIHFKTRGSGDYESRRICGKLRNFNTIRGLHTRICGHFKTRDFENTMSTDENLRIIYHNTKFCDHYRARDFENTRCCINFKTRGFGDFENTRHCENLRNFNTVKCHNTGICGNFKTRDFENPLSNDNFKTRGIKNTGCRTTRTTRIIKNTGYSKTRSCDFFQTRMLKIMKQRPLTGKTWKKMFKRQTYRKLPVNAGTKLQETITIDHMIWSSGDTTQNFSSLDLRNCDSKTPLAKTTPSARRKNGAIRGHTL
jgi:hypothetical protein